MIKEKLYQNVSFGGVLKLFITCMLIVILMFVFVSFLTVTGVKEVVLKYDKVNKTYDVVVERNGFFNDVICFSSVDYEQAFKVFVETRKVYIKGGGQDRNTPRSGTIVKKLFFREY